MQGGCQLVKDVAGLHADRRSIYAGVTAESGFLQQVAVYKKLNAVFGIMHQPEDRGGAGSQLQQLFHGIF